LDRFTDEPEETVSSDMKIIDLRRTSGEGQAKIYVFWLDGTEFQDTNRDFQERFSGREDSKQPRTRRFQRRQYRRDTAAERHWHILACSRLDWLVNGVIGMQDARCHVEKLNAG
jgi:hypothetical protein